jgi:hypothetical protein
MRWHSVSRGKGGRRNRIGKVSQSITSACDLRLRGCNVIETHEHAQRLQRVVKVCSTGIKPSPLSFYCIQAKLKPAFVFGFAAWTPAQIRESLLRLASALR